MNQASAHQTLFLCRPEFLSALCDELKHQYDEGLNHQATAPGVLLISSDKSPPASCIFEHQRMRGPSLIPMEKLKPIEEETIRSVFQSNIAINPY